jgi:copper chaperone CopZ
MEKVTFSIPTMWADHHTLAVRHALGQVDGVSDVIASSLYKDVLVKYDPAVVAPDVLANTLAEAGYEVGKELEVPAHAARIDDASDWFRFQDRVTETNMRDLEMSGDHRKY